VNCVAANDKRRAERCQSKRLLADLFVFMTKRWSKIILLSLDHAFIIEAKEPVMADHDVVQNSYAHDIADFFEPSGDVDVLRTRRGVAARMIMDENNGGGGIANHRVINFARVN
jgi:hypothetical protein